MVDSVRAHGGVLHPGVPNVAGPDKARRAHVAHRVSVAVEFCTFFKYQVGFLLAGTVVDIFFSHVPLSGSVRTVWVFIGVL